MQNKLLDIFLAQRKISTDSRKIEEGAIFFALSGENFDGNSFARAALDKGASYAVISNPALTGERYIYVKDCLVALQQLACDYRKYLGLKIIALTGSNGKTTTKEFLLRTLSTKFQCLATCGNLNNHIGVPLTLLSFDESTQVGIVEMGANHQREIELLCSIAQPDIGLITNVGIAHLEGFGSAEGVRKGKGELFDYLLKRGGVAIYNSKDETLRNMIASREGLRAVGYDPERELLELSIYGTYNQLNAQAALAVGRYLGCDDGAIKEALKGYIADNNRSQVVDTGRNRLIMDAYNANPSSMRAAITNFANSAEFSDKVLILGDMRELGDYSKEEHEKIVELIANYQFDNVLLVGENFSALQSHFLSFLNASLVLDYLSNNQLDNKIILIKGSRGIALEQIAELL